MRHALVVLTGIVAAACYGASEAPTGSNPPVEDNTVRIVDGPALCDGCRTVSFDIAGPDADLTRVFSATLVATSTGGQTLPADIELRRFTTDSGLVLRTNASFTDSVRTGDYDLQLRLLLANGSTGQLMVLQALRVTAPSGPSGGGGTGGGGTGGGGTGGGGSQSPPPPTEQGQIRVTVSVSGLDVDTQFDAFLGTEDDWLTAGLVPGVPLLWTVAVGERNVWIDGVASNCTVVGGSSRQVRVAPGMTQTVDFQVTCTAFAFIRLSAAYSGEAPIGDAQYTCNDGQCGGGQLVGTSPVLLSVGAGTRSIRLQPPVNCTVVGANPMAVNAVVGVTVDVQFALTCVPLYGTVHVTVRTSGTNIDTSFYVVVGYAGCEFWGECEGYAPIRSTVDLVLYRGDQSIRLGDIAANCVATSSNPLTVTVRGGETVEAGFDVTCN